jgi:tyrosine-protein phosphatase SIW14
MKNLVLSLFFALLFATPSLQAKIDRFQEVAPGIWRGSEPKNQSDFEMLKGLGVQTIISLEWDSGVKAERAQAHSNGFEFINIPIVAKDRPEDAAMAEIFKYLLSKEHQPIFLHCKLGKDRTGLVFALYRVKIQGWSPRAAYEEWLSFGFSYRFLRNLDNYFREQTGFSN